MLNKAKTPLELLEKRAEKGFVGKSCKRKREIENGEMGGIVLGH